MRWIRFGAAVAALAVAPACASGSGGAARAARSSIGAVGVGEALPAQSASPIDPAATTATAPAQGPPAKVGTPAAAAPPTTKVAATPAPPPPAAVVGARPAGTATATAAGTTVTLRIAPTEQFRGELFHPSVDITGATAVRSVKLDLGNGIIVDSEPAPAWGCPNGPRQVMAGPPAHSYTAAGRYTVTALVTVVPCVFVPGQTGAVVMPWVASGPEKVVQVRMDLTQRADPPPPS